MAYVLFGVEIFSEKDGIFNPSRIDIGNLNSGRYRIRYSLNAAYAILQPSLPPSLS